MPQHSGWLAVQMLMNQLLINLANLVGFEDKR